MLCLRLIFFFLNSTFFLMLPWDLFGRTLIAGLHKYIPYLGEKKPTINKCYLRRTFFEVAELVTLGNQVISLSAPTPATVRAELCLGVCWSG